MMNEKSESGTMSNLSSREIFNNINDNHGNNNNNGTTTITRYIHIKHADSSVKIFRETTVWYRIYNSCRFSLQTCYVGKYFMNLWLWNCDATNLRIDLTTSFLKYIDNWISLFNSNASIIDFNISIILKE